MAKDEFSQQRTKKKLAFEIRYSPILESFDKRGEVLKNLNDVFKIKIPHWRVSNIEVQLQDNQEKPSKIIAIDHRACRIIYEDCGSLQEFNDDAKKLMEVFFNTYSKNVNEILRAGVRFQSIFEFPKYKSFNDILSKLQKEFISQSSPLTISLSDIQFIFNHDSGAIFLGPVKKGENWIKENFFFPEQNIPNCGVGLDVDSFAVNTSIQNLDSLSNLFITVEQLTTATEREILSPFLLEKK